MNLKRQVFDGIIDSAAEEFFAVNTTSVRSVQQYAEGAFDAYLKEDDAHQVLLCIKKWKHLVTQTADQLAQIRELLK